MWPRRKILFVIPRGVKGWQGILPLLETLHKEVIVRETSEDSAVDLANLTFPGVDQECEDLSDVGPTEILYWPGVPIEDGYRKWGFDRGIEQKELPEFLHSFWEEDILLPVVQPTLGEEPLLWSLLMGAGFEPSLIWKNSKGEWVTRIGRGMHWILPEEIMKVCYDSERTTFGREPQKKLSTSGWILDENRVDFYSDRENFSYLGSLERSMTSSEQEQGIYDTVLLALQLGVPWRDILSVYKMIFKSPRDDIVELEIV